MGIVLRRRAGDPVDRPRLRAARPPPTDARLLDFGRSHGAARRACGGRGLHGERPQQLHERRGHHR